MAVDTLFKGLTRQERKELEFFAPMTEAFIWLRGKARSGKTASSVSIAYNLRKYFGKTPILDFKPYPAFGYYQYMGTIEFIEMLEAFGDLTEQGKLDGLDKEALKETFKRELGYDLMDSTIVLDEAYKSLRSRTPSKKVVLAYNSFLQTYGHYFITMVIISPFANMIDKDVTRQVTLPLNCSYDSRSMRVMAQGLDRNTLDVVRLITPIKKYGEMYNSWSPQAILRRRKIEVQGL